MRPPKLKWQHTARAVLRLTQAVEALAAAREEPQPQALVLAIKRARIATARLRKHIQSSEDCEMD